MRKKLRPAGAGFVLVVAVAVAAALAGVVVGRATAPPRPEPGAVNALRLAFPDETRHRGTTELGDLAAAVNRHLAADDAPAAVAEVERRIGADEQTARQVVLTVWGALGSPDPVPFAGP